MKGINRGRSPARPSRRRDNRTLRRILPFLFLAVVLVVGYADASDMAMLTVLNDTDAILFDCPDSAPQVQAVLETTDLACGITTDDFELFRAKYKLALMDLDDPPGVPWTYMKFGDYPAYAGGFAYGGAAYVVMYVDMDSGAGVLVFKK